MNSKPHFVLFSRTEERTSTCGAQGGRWYFSLTTTRGVRQLEASDVELEASRERLEILALVRGLEALPQPSNVTLVTSNRQIAWAVREGLEQWRSADWTWERFGNRVPIKNGDLWERVDHALNIHQVQCRRIRIDAGHQAPTSRRLADAGRLRASETVIVPNRTLLRPFATSARILARCLERIAQWLNGLLPENQPSPHPTM